MRKAERINKVVYSNQTNPWIWVGLKPKYRVAAKHGVKIMNVSEILKTVSKSLNISVEEILGQDRRKQITEARMISVGFILMTHGFSLKRIGSIFNKHHATIIYLRNKFNDLNEYDFSFQKKVQSIMTELKANLEEDLTKD